MMRKYDELHDPNSCMSRAHSGEMVFVLLARDQAAPAAIRSWVDERIRLGKNKSNDPQITEALNCAQIMELESEVSQPLVTYSPTVDLKPKQSDDKVKLIKAVQDLGRFWADLAANDAIAAIRLPGDKSKQTKAGISVARDEVSQKLAAKVVELIHIHWPKGT